jgi:hypothetical protein
VRVRRIELPTTAWKAVVLPLNYTRKREAKEKFIFLYASSAAGASYAYTRGISILYSEPKYSTDDSTTIKVKIPAQPAILILYAIYHRCRRSYLNSLLGFY